MNSREGDAISTYESADRLPLEDVLSFTKAFEWRIKEILWIDVVENVSA